MRKLGVSIAIAALFAIGGSTAAAAPNPSGTGQPGAECGSANATVEPAGFGTTGFSLAESVYAGSEGTKSAANGSSHAVSQYDVACFQLTSSRH